jgi:hypothetical protein
MSRKWKPAVIEWRARTGMGPIISGDSHAIDGTIPTPKLTHPQDGWSAVVVKLNFPIS